MDEEAEMPEDQPIPRDFDELLDPAQWAGEGGRRSRPGSRLERAERRRGPSETTLAAAMANALHGGGMTGVA